jgi:hypothetical protein
MTGSKPATSNLGKVKDGVQRRPGLSSDVNRKPVLTCGFVRGCPQTSGRLR